MQMKLFDKWPTDEVKVADKGLEQYICLKPAIVPRSSGRLSSLQHGKSKINIIERLITRMMVPGHRSRKHVISSDVTTGKYTKQYNTIKKAFETIESRTKKNPVEVLVRAIENAALREEIAAYQVGGIVVRRAVVTSPQRRLDLALRTITQAAYRKSFGKGVKIADALANELLAAAENDASRSEAVKERERIEREAEGAR
ncbi:MAG: 30S ribosomal protein S7 [Candidatus Aenigmatarchaeota archaeon]